MKSKTLLLAGVVGAALCTSAAGATELKLLTAGAFKSTVMALLPDYEKASGNKVFLVHGHDERAIHETARFLEKLDVEVVILREQPNSGRTIIEKFVDYSDVTFAVVLLTGDDRGGVVTASFDAHRLRARQNVILELGFFLGRLGRMRVCALYQEGVEIPSDYSGVIFTAVDAAGAWRLALAKELKAAGLPIDMNKAL